jgi:hypothetical protein
MISLNTKLYILAVILIGSITTACFAQKVRNLKRLDAHSLSIFIDSTYLRLPGYSVPVAFSVSSPKGTFYTRGLGGGSVRWNNFDVTVKGGTFFNGRITVSPKLFPGDFIDCSM